MGKIPEYFKPILDYIMGLYAAYVGYNSYPAPVVFMARVVESVFCLGELWYMHNLRSNELVGWIN
jgi:hypothetical protein